MMRRGFLQPRRVIAVTAFAVSRRSTESIFAGRKKHAPLLPAISRTLLARWVDDAM